jgi:hypothetical protein
MGEKDEFMHFYFFNRITPVADVVFRILIPVRTGGAEVEIQSMLTRETVCVRFSPGIDGHFFM